MITPKKKCTPGVETTWEIRPDGKCITFHPCENFSFHRKDIEYKFCSVCGRYLDGKALLKDTLGRLKNK